MNGSLLRLYKWMDVNFRQASYLAARPAEQAALAKAWEEERFVRRRFDEYRAEKYADSLKDDSLKDEESC